jgi:hypothetical protein
VRDGKLAVLARSCCERINRRVLSRARNATVDFDVIRALRYSLRNEVLCFALAFDQAFGIELWRLLGLVVGIPALLISVRPSLSAERLQQGEIHGCHVEGGGNAVAS